MGATRGEPEERLAHLRSDRVVETDEEYSGHLATIEDAS